MCVYAYSVFTCTYVRLHCKSIDNKYISASYILICVCVCAAARNFSCKDSIFIYVHVHIICSFARKKVDVVVFILHSPICCHYCGCCFLTIIVVGTHAFILIALHLGVSKSAAAQPNNFQSPPQLLSTYRCTYIQSSPFRFCYFPIAVS